MKKLRIKSDGNVILPNKMIENHNNCLEKYSMSNYIDLTSGDLSDKKFSFTWTNTKLTSRDSYPTSNITSNGLLTFIEKNGIDGKVLDISDYRSNLDIKIKMYISYKIQINRGLSNGKNVDVSIGYRIKRYDIYGNNTGYKYIYSTICHINNPNNIIEGTCELDVSQGIIESIVPWFFVDEVNSNCDHDIDIIYSNYSISVQKLDDTIIDEFLFSANNIKSRSRDTYLSNATISPFVSNNSLVNFVDFNNSLSPRIAIFYKFKINENNSNCNINIGMRLSTSNNQHEWIYYTIGNLSELDNIVEGVCILGIKDLDYTYISPWVFLNKAVDAIDDDIDLIYCTYEILNTPLNITALNKLVFYADGMRIIQYGSDDTNNYDIKNLKILLEDGSCLSTDKITLHKCIDKDCVIPMGGNILSTDRNGTIEFGFDQVYGIVNIEFDHNNLKHYHEKVDLLYKKVSNYYTVYNSYAKGDYTGVRKVFDYYSNRHVDLKMQHNSMSKDGLVFNNIGDNLSNISNLRYHNCNVSILGNDENISERYIVRVSPKITTNSTYIDTGSIGTSGLGGDYKLSVWMRLTEDCNINNTVYLSFRDNSQNTDITTVQYDMNRKGEWQLLHCYLPRSKTPNSICAYISLSNGNWTKGYVEIAPNFALTYTRIGDPNPQRIYMQNFSILSLNNEIVNQKSVYIECVPNTIRVSSSTTNLLTFGVDSNTNLQIRQCSEDNSLKIYSNKSLCGSYSYIPNNLVKILINKNGKIYINGSLICTVTLPSSVTYTNVGYSKYDDYLNNSVPFSGIVKRIISFRDVISDEDSIICTRCNHVSIPLDYISEYNEYPNRPNENYTRYYFPLKESLYDFRGDILLPSNGSLENIIQGVGYSCGTTSPNKMSITKYIHLGNKNNESIISATAVHDYATMSGHFEVLDPENLSDDDYVCFKTSNTDTPSKEKGVLLKSCTDNFFKLSDYKIPSVPDKYYLYIKSKATIIFYDLTCTSGSNAKSLNNNVAALGVKLQNLIDYKSDFTIVYDVTYNKGRDYRCEDFNNSLGYWSTSLDFVCFGKTNSTFEPMIRSDRNGRTIITKHNNLTKYDWINGTKLRITIIHTKSEKKVYIKIVRLNDSSIYIEGYMIYPADTLRLESTTVKDCYTLVACGWGDGNGISSCGGIVSDMHIIQKALSDDELSKYLSPFSIMKDNSLRAGIQFSELNNI